MGELAQKVVTRTKWMGLSHGSCNVVIYDLYELNIEIEKYTTQHTRQQSLRMYFYIFFKFVRLLSYN